MAEFDNHPDPIVGDDTIEVPKHETIKLKAPGGATWNLKINDEGTIITELEE